MHVFVPDKTGHKGQNGDNYNRSRAGDPGLIVLAHRSESQSASDTVDRTPSNARDHVQNDREAIWKVEGEREPGKRQLAEAELWTECGEKGDGDCTEEVEEDDGEDCRSELETKYGSTEGPERDGCYCGVGGKPHPHAVGQALTMVPLIGEDSFNPSRLDSVQSINDIPQLGKSLKA